MNRAEAASPPLIPLRLRHARLRARPSGLKGRCRDRCATGPRPALDPGASTGPYHAAVTGRRTALPAQRAAQTPPTKIKSLQPSLYGFRGLPPDPTARPRICVPTSPTFSDQNDATAEIDSFAIHVGGRSRWWSSAMRRACKSLLPATRMVLSASVNTATISEVTTLSGPSRRP